jgi:phosphoribosylformylglycinamidine cyclo-ligase
MRSHEYDLAGAGVGVVEEDDVLGADRVRAGDIVLAMASSGLHSNGYALARHVLLRAARLRLDAEIDELGEDVGTLGDVLLAPTRIYAKTCLALAAETDVHAFAHVTGGGLAGNVARIVPDGLEAVVDRSTWAVPPIFRLVEARGRVASEEMERTFNQGVGMVAVLPAADTDRALALLAAQHVPAWPAGEVRRAEGTGGTARLVGAHPTPS